MNPRAIIVDDNEENLYFLQILLQNDKFEVVSCRNGQEALESARANKPDLIITDILMPVMDGFTLCRIWKSDPDLCNIPFVFYTATYTDTKDEQFALSLGADLFIVKPKEPAEFMALIQKVLDRQCAGTLHAKKTDGPPENIYLKAYNETLIRKLEGKLEQLETSNRALSTAVSEKEILMRELFHRTKNHMQIIASVLELHAMNTENPEVREVVQSTLVRIKTISMAHEKLYETGDLSRINAREYLGELAAWAIGGRAGIVLEIDIDPVLLLMDTAIPCGLIATELVFNSLRHAFPSGKDGKIFIRMHKLPNNGFELIIGDNGMGLGADFNLKKCTTFGLSVVVSLVEKQLQGTLEYQNEQGAKFIIRFKDRLYKPRV